MTELSPNSSLQGAREDRLLWHGLGDFPQRYPAGDFFAYQSATVLTTCM